MKIYLASAYARRPEMQQHAKVLQKLGHIVTSRWVLETNEYVDEHTASQKYNSQCAQKDWDDIKAADIMINFTEEKGKGSPRGGRHVECGLALAWKKPVVVVGYRENIFHWLDCITFVYSIEEAIKWMEKYKELYD